ATGRAPRQHEFAPHRDRPRPRHRLRCLGVERGRKSHRRHDSLTSLSPWVTLPSKLPSRRKQSKWPSRDRSKSFRCPTSSSWSAYPERRASSLSPEITTAATST